MRYSIITPSLARPTLRRLCESIDAQSAENWEHLIAIDVPLIARPEARAIVESLPKHPRRKIFRCGIAHRNYGNTCRRNLWENAKGDYLLYADDDNFLARPDALESLDVVTADWAIFPMTRMGARFYADPPEFGKFDTGNMLIKREHGRWPETEKYAADWELADRLMKSVAYQALPDFEPVIVMERSGRGRE